MECAKDRVYTSKHIIRFLIAYCVLETKIFTFASEFLLIGMMLLPKMALLPTLKPIYLFFFLLSQRGKLYLFTF